METAFEIRKTAFLGDYLPRKRAIATFTSDLLTAVTSEDAQSQCVAVPVNATKGGYEYPDVVRFELEEQDQSSCKRAADYLNLGKVDIVCPQNKFGIFRGPTGSHLVTLLSDLKIPVITMLHTVLCEPNADSRRVRQGFLRSKTLPLTRWEC